MRKKWDELDLFRGFAGLFMLANHAGVAWLPPELATGYSLSGILTSVGSFAPVLFFFATGIGYGLQAVDGYRKRHDYGFINKICILFVCDQFLAWEKGAICGFDFLGFIALSMLFLELIRRAQRPILYATIAFLAAFVLRFAVGPLLASFTSDAETMLWIDRIFGRVGTPRVSYPLLPWICFPLAGFVLGFFAQRNESQLKQRFLPICAIFLIVALLSFAAGGFLIVNNHPPMRWGSMSISYFCLSVGVLAISLFLALWALRVPMLSPINHGFSLRGMSSLAVVPLHYFFVDLFGIVLGTVSNDILFLIANALLVAVVFPSSRLVAAAGHWTSNLSRQRLAWSLLSAATALAGALLILGLVNSELAALSITCAGQLCLCVLLVVRLPRRTLHAS